MSLFLLILGSAGSVLFWIILVRPYVVSHGQGYKTGANIAAAVWVDWQSCGEIAKAQNDNKGRALFYILFVLQLMGAFGFIGLFL